MFSIYRKLFLALKKILILKITAPQVPFTQKKNSSSKISDFRPLGGNSLTPHTHTLTLFGKPWWYFKN